MPILVDHGDLLMAAITRTRKRVAFELHAWVIVPDHFHIVVDSQSTNISGILQRIKMDFGAHWRSRLGLKAGRVWQKRFWDHVIRDEADLLKHCDYIHYNPVKHGLVESPFEWPHSSIRQFYATESELPDLARYSTGVETGQFGE